MFGFRTGLILGIVSCFNLHFVDVEVLVFEKKRVFFVYLSNLNGSRSNVTSKSKKKDTPGNNINR